VSAWVYEEANFSFHIRLPTPHPRLISPPEKRSAPCRELGSRLRRFETLVTLCDSNGGVQCGGAGSTRGAGGGQEDVDEVADVRQVVHGTGLVICPLEPFEAMMVYFKANYADRSNICDWSP
jgi:hypothetical protein